MSGEATLRGSPPLSPVKDGSKASVDESALRHRLRVEARRLLLYRAERPADGKRGKAPVSAVLRQVQVTDQGDAVAVLEGDFLMVGVSAFWEGLIPSTRHCLCLCVGRSE